MTDKLTKEERAIVESKRDSGMLSTREVIRIIDRIAPKPEPERIWLNVWRGPNEWAFITEFRSKERADKDRAFPMHNTYLGRWVFAVDGSSATWEGAND